MSICSWNDSHGTTCKWPGPFSTDTHGGGRYYCVWHWRAFGLDRLEMKSEGDQVVRDSYEWDGSQESYVALRKASQVAKQAKPGGSGTEERKGAYAASVFRDDEIGASTISIANAALAGLAPRVQSEDADAIH